jgi:hypothetical protein
MTELHPGDSRKLRTTTLTPYRLAADDTDSELYALNSSLPQAKRLSRDDVQRSDRLSYIRPRCGIAETP